jgi:NAD(P)-dependent dehydrogenase (short-subunit alcohol dehydrogenase family)
MSYDHSPVTVEGKNAVVIGGTSGLGEAIALGFAAEGADVIATSRTESKVASVTERIRDRGGETVAQTCDVTDRDSLIDLRETAADTFGSIDVLVNSPGTIARANLLEVTEEEWDHVLDVQLTGVRRACQLFARTMDTGSIINISSLSAIVALSNVIAYSSAKGGIDALTRSAAKELAPEIRVNAIRPGLFLTPLTEDTYGEGGKRHEELIDRTPHARIGQPNELTGAAIYLASDAATYTTGEIIRIDGGFTDSTFE